LDTTILAKIQKSLLDIREVTEFLGVNWISPFIFIRFTIDVDMGAVNLGSIRICMWRTINIKSNKHKNFLASSLKL